LAPQHQYEQENSEPEGRQQVRHTSSPREGLAQHEKTNIKTHSNADHKGTGKNKARISRIETTTETRIRAINTRV
jgi:hypothetical protein